MKKLISVLLALVLILSGCGQEEPEGVLISNEAYEEFMAAKQENDQLKNEIDYLEARLEDFINKEATSNDTSTSTETTTETSSDNTTSDTTSDDKTEDNKEEAKDDTETSTEEESFEVTSETYNVVKIEPRNDVKEGSSFAKFLDEYREALQARDEAYVKAHTHPNVKISFGGHSGWDGLVSYWDLDEGSEGFYKMMNTTLKYGIVDTSGGQGNQYTGPYYFVDWPEEFDAFEYYAVIGANVNVRSKPSTDGEVVRQVTYEVVRVADNDDDSDGWYKVELPEGREGYIYATYVKSPIHYRASFTKVDDTWLLDFFVKGD